MVPSWAQDGVQGTSAMMVLSSNTSPIPPRVTVIVPTYNGLRYLLPCLAALRAQTYRSFAVLVVDDGSTDDTAEILARDYPEVALIRFAQNGGLVRGQNAAIALCSTEFVALLNNDTEADPNWLAHLVAAADAHPTAWAVAGKLLLWDRRDTLHAAGDGFGTDGVPRNIGVWERDVGQHDAGQWLFGPQGGAAFYRRSALQALSVDNAIGIPFDTYFFMYCEDVDLNWRANLYGFETAFAPDAVVYHHLSATAGGVIASYYVGRNMIAVLVKDVPGALLRRHFGAMMTAQIRFVWQSIWHVREPAARARLRGQFAVVRILLTLIRSRRTVQQSRRVTIDALEAMLYPSVPTNV